MPGMRLLAATAIALVLAACGTVQTESKGQFQRRLTRDVAHVEHAMTSPWPTGDRSVLIAAARRMEGEIHRARIDLASVTPPADAAADVKVILRSWLRVERTVAAVLAGRPFRNVPYAAFGRALEDLRVKGYRIGT